MPLAGEALIRRIIAWTTHCGVRELVLNLHHLPETITAQVGDGADLSASVRYSWESPVLGSAGGPRKALSLLPDEPFFIINGDTLTNLDLAALSDHHDRTGAVVTMAVVQNRWPGRYGGVVTDSAGRVHGFVPRGSGAASYHFIGVQVANPSVFAGLELGAPAESVGDLYRALIAASPGSVRAMLVDAPFIDVGTPADYLEACLAIARQEAKPSAQIGIRASIDDSARVVDSAIWDDVEIGAKAVLERCVVADGVKIAAGAHYSNCAIVQQQGELVVTDITYG